MVKRKPKGELHKIHLTGPRVGYRECRECGKKFLLATILSDGLCKKCASE